MGAGQHIEKQVKPLSEDKIGCITYHSRKWEAGVDVIGFKVQVAYSAGNPNELVMYHDSIEPQVIRPPT